MQDGGLKVSDLRGTEIGLEADEVKRIIGQQFPAIAPAEGRSALMSAGKITLEFALAGRRAGSMH